MSVEVSLTDGVQVLRLSRPEKRNALNRDMYRVLIDALEGSDADDGIRVNVIFGSEGNFTAGNDIADFLATSRGETGPPREVLRFIERLPLLSKPLLAGVDGPAIGIGTTLLLHCDLVYATPRATFATPFLDLGLVPEAASSLLLPRVMGYPRAFEMLILGETFSAGRACGAGLVNTLVEPDALEVHVLAKAARLARKPPAALLAARRLIRGDATAVLERTRAEAAEFA
ncbi:MAG: enoyl-CoA hydratase-related protein, partial [Deltaproteobacteria bacterium]